MAVICSVMAIVQSIGPMIIRHANHNPTIHTSMHSNNLANPIPLLTPVVMILVTIDKVWIGNTIY
jgi:hypothetical protein